MQKPVVVAEQRAAALRFADPRVQGLLHILLLFLLVQGTFRNRDLREHIAPLLGKKPGQLTPGRMTYDLRRLRLHGLIERIPKTHCYRAIIARPPPEVLKPRGWLSEKQASAYLELALATS